MISEQRLFQAKGNLSSGKGVTKLMLHRKGNLASRKICCFNFLRLIEVLSLVFKQLNYSLHNIIKINAGVDTEILEVRIDQLVESLLAILIL
jgi:hypothetical protein